MKKKDLGFLSTKHFYFRSTPLVAYNVTYCDAHKNIWSYIKMFHIYNVNKLL